VGWGGEHGGAAVLRGCMLSREGATCVPAEGSPLMSYCVAVERDAAVELKRNGRRF